MADLKRDEKLIYEDDYLVLIETPTGGIHGHDKSEGWYVPPYWANAQAAQASLDHAIDALSNWGK